MKSGKIHIFAPLDIISWIDKSNIPMKKKQTSAISRIFKTHIVDALSFMAMGLFCSLILGLIIKQIALIPGFDFD